MKFNNGAQAMPRTERRILMKLVPLKHFYFLWREEIASIESIVIKCFWISTILVESQLSDLQNKTVIDQFNRMEQEIQFGKICMKTKLAARCKKLTIHQ
jgi:hypothetical protein